ncbi:MAG: hypothetical protein JXQ90_18240 [Cyclobacteriaceae bacterium]
MKNRKSNYSSWIALLFIAVLAYSCQESENELLAEKVPSQSFKVENNTLIFSDKETMGSLLSNLSDMSYEEYKEWCIDHNFSSARLAFETFLNEESAIDDYYEKILEDDPNAVIPSDKERYASLEKHLNTTAFTIIEDPDGSYYDYNFRQVNLSSILSKDRKTVIGEHEYRYELDAYFVRNLKDGSVSGFSYGVKEVSSNGRIATITSPDHAWQFFGTNNNSWLVDNKRRFQVWMEGASQTYGNNITEVNNALYAKRMKKRFGKWKYSGTNTLSTNASELVAHVGPVSDPFGALFEPNQYFPLVTNSVPPVYRATENSPLTWVGSVNNMTLLLWPHNYGVFGSNGPLRIPAQQSYVSMTILFGGHTFVLDPNNGGYNY